MAVIDGIIDRGAMTQAAYLVLTEKRDSMIEQFGKKYKSSIKSEFKNAYNIIKNRVNGMYSGDNQIMLLKDIIKYNINAFIEKVVSITSGSAVNSIAETVVSKEPEVISETKHRETEFEITPQSKSSERGGKNRDRFMKKEPEKVQPDEPAKVSAISADEIAKIRGEMLGESHSAHTETQATTPSTPEQRTEE